MDPMTDLDAARVDVEHRLRRGERFDDVENAINAAPLNDAAKAALWLLAWSYVPWRAQRRWARRHIDALTVNDEPRLRLVAAR